MYGDGSDPDDRADGSGSIVQNRPALATTPARELALDCVAAGVEAARPETVIEGAVTVADGRARRDQGEDGGDGDHGEDGGGDGGAGDGTRPGEVTLRIGDTVYDLDAFDEVLVVGGGKAAARAAAALAERLGPHLDGGVVVTDDPTPAGPVAVREGDHPVPGEAGVAGAEAVVERARAVGEGTLLLGVVTGGASALLPAPVGAVGLDGLRSVTGALLESGATIGEINAVRKHCSRLKGGRLARVAAPATVAALLFSDVVGDDPAVIGSGPFAPDETTYADALAVLDRYGIDAPAVRAHFRAGAAEGGDGPGETPGADDPAVAAVDTHVLANGWTAIRAARTVARDRGYEPLVLSSRCCGEAREAAHGHAAVAGEALATGNPVAPPAVVLSGGELTVTLADGSPDRAVEDGDSGDRSSGGDGETDGEADGETDADGDGDPEGGPNREFALAAALSLPAGATLAAVDTDGRDGASAVAGAVVDADTVAGPDDERAAREALAVHDAGGFLDDRGASIRTGRTGTNVNDLHVLVLED